MIFDKNDFVYVRANRGKTPGMARITRIRSYNEADIIFENGEKDTYYFAHLYQTPECFKRKLIWMKERADKIGK